ncbi:MAG: hypothetical protein O2821_06275 [Chloroflexi bacterium]|nr:hypothetical protein [Chloroflexota bacterium]MDA1226350.1 hypothetical protein [Chloroflexota bacterium]
MEEDQLSQFGFADLSLLDGERVEMSLDLTEGSPESLDHDVLLLTDRRLMHLNGGPKNRKASMASVQDILITEMMTENEGISAFIWAGLAFFVGLMLWRVVDHPMGSAAAGIVLALMGIYLIYDRLTSPGKNMLVFKAGVGDMKVEVRNEGATSELNGLILRLFELKDENGLNRYRNPSNFALR